MIIGALIRYTGKDTQPQSITINNSYSQNGSGDSFEPPDVIYLSVTTYNSSAVEATNGTNATDLYRYDYQSKSATGTNLDSKVRARFIVVLTVGYLLLPKTRQ